MSNVSGWIALKATHLVIFALGGFAVPAIGLAQEIGIMVQPVILEVQPRPGESVALPVSVRSTSATAVQTVETALWPLYQSPEGKFAVLEPGSDPLPPPPGRSCLAWTRVDKETLQIPPGGVETVRVSMQVPPNAVGFYAGALIVQTKPEPRPGAITLRIRFLVPILIHIQGRAVTRKVTTRGAGMALIPKSDKEQAGTLFTVSVANEGETLATVSGSLTVFVESAGRWRRVTRITVPERRLLPGTSAAIPIRSEMRLPRGKFRLTAELTMDGSRLPQAMSEVEYQGDPEIASVSSEADIMALPSVVEVQCAPGATRTATFAIRNGGTEPVVLAGSASAPPSLQGVAYGELKGDDLDGSKMVAVTAPGSTIAPGREGRFRLTIQLPSDGAPRPAYYAVVNVSATSPEGQPVGNIPVLVVIRNQSAKATEKLAPSGRVTLVRSGDGVIQAIGRFSNLGDTDIEFRWSADLLQGGGPTVSAVLHNFEDDSQRLLPLATAVCNVRFDLARLAPGTYTLRFAGRTLRGDAVYLTTGLRVTDGPSGKEVEIINTPSDQGDGAPTEKQTTGERDPGVSSGSVGTQP